MGQRAYSPELNAILIKMKGKWYLHAIGSKYQVSKYCVILGGVYQVTYREEGVGGWGTVRTNKEFLLHLYIKPTK